MQSFYWDCPGLGGADFQWWNHVTSKIPSLKQVGFTALWLPPASKAPNPVSMGYDPYDYYDLGEFENKNGRKETWFGTRADLEKLIRVAHQHGLDVYADLVFNHNSGADDEEVNPIDGKKRWTKYQPESGQFPRDWKCFHPSLYESWDDGVFGEGMPDLCHRNPYVFDEIMKYAQWLIEILGFDGFRYDMVKGYGPWLITALQEFRYSKGDSKYSYKIYGVGECWDSTRKIEDWLEDANRWSDNPVRAFDFELRGRLKALCDSFGYDLRNLTADGTLVKDNPFLAVSFVENHDVHRPGDPNVHNPVINDKMLAYAYILTHEGDPCVFWPDYYNYGLGLEGEPSGIAALVRVHGSHAGGTTSVLHVDEDLYIMQRNGFDAQPGLVFVMNNLGDRWNGQTVQTRWKATRFVPVAWRGRDDAGKPQEEHTGADGKADFWAPPRGYAVYVPQV